MRWSIPPSTCFSELREAFRATGGKAEARDRWAAIEAALVWLAIMLHIWALRLAGYPRSWLVILGAVIASHLVRREKLSDLGFRREGFEESWREYVGPVVLAVLVLIAAGATFRTFRPVTTESAFFSLSFYCFWGLFQQYVLNGYFANRIRRANPWRSANAIAWTTAALFALAHFPNWFLMPATLVGGYVSARAWLAHRNLYFLGIVHGLIGFLLYLVVPDDVTRHLYVGPKWFRP